jgi:primosomal protein N'
MEGIVKYCKHCGIEITYYGHKPPKTVLCHSCEEKAQVTREE